MRCFDYLFYVDFEVREESDVEYVVTKLKVWFTPPKHIKLEDISLVKMAPNFAL